VRWERHGTNGSRAACSDTSARASARLGSVGDLLTRMWSPADLTALARSDRPRLAPEDPDLIEAATYPETISIAADALNRSH